MRILLLLFGLAITGIGIGSLNYTTDGKAVHHREWAKEKGFPEPNNTIFMLGLACTAGGGAFVGYMLGKPRRPR